MEKKIVKNLKLLKTDFKNISPDFKSNEFSNNHLLLVTDEMTSSNNAIFNAVLKWKQ